MLVSIITASLNNEKTISKSLESVAFQTYKNIEHIIIDGESNDKTLNIISSFPNIKKVISERDFGIYYALNKGIDLAGGDIIGFVHADDFLISNKIIENIVNCFQNYNVDAVYGDLQYISAENNKIIRYWKSCDYTSKLLKKGWMPPHPTFFVKKDVYDKYGKFDTSFRIAADYDLILRFFSNKISTKYLPEVFVNMTIGGESNKSVKNILKKSREDYRAIKKNKIGGILTLLNKNFSKITQFFKRK